MQKTIEQIEAVLAQKIPQFAKTLNPPATESDFEALETLVGNKLPEEFKMFYKWHNGQNRSPYVAFHVETHEILMPIADIIEWYDELSGQLDTGDIEQHRWQRIWVPFTDNGSGDSTCIDISEENFGQIVIQDGWDDEVKVIFNSLTDWLEDLLVKIKEFDYSNWDYLDRL
ncbi:hypothetical protein DLE54_09490 [Psychrobacter sp. YP14]|uniref:SMI1/KNR4 family protein n=1 Tax=Psychrobacter sp. YP14 TaxID=2203895 RepID=UPI000D7D4AAA|nr:SMI1/KNR4 family protein [Psychrobacter sp. YP14]AWT49715.1 hypothetical protein DLE54_09490 [Psychrobacter sp. YP14]